MAQLRRTSSALPPLRRWAPLPGLLTLALLSQAARSGTTTDTAETGDTAAPAETGGAVALGGPAAPPIGPVLIINEFAPDVDNSAPGDASCDGSLNGNDDRFVEIVNIGTELINLAGHNLAVADLTTPTSFAIRHAFPAGTILAPGEAVVVFDGDPRPNPPAAGHPHCVTTGPEVLFQTSSTGNLDIPSSGQRRIAVRNAVGTVLADASYDNDDVDNNTDTSLTRSRDLDPGAPFILHEVAHPGRAISPGLMGDFSLFQEGCTQVVDWYADADGDGFGTGPVLATNCTGVPASADNDLDCDDTQSAIFPDAPEICDGLVNNCDDPGPLRSDEVDVDGDGFVVCAIDIGGWNNPATEPDGGGDCNDAEPTIFPTAAELCDGQRNDCAVAGVPLPELDLDGDGRVTCLIDAGGWDGPVVPAGGGDCNDADETVYPLAAELCDGLKNDCTLPGLPANEVDDDLDGFVDCPDLDPGGWDGPGLRPDGAGDCDDLDATVFPGAPERCDGQINACGLLALDPEEVDSDADGFVTCLIDGGGWDGPGSPTSGDCKEGDATVFPGAADRCDGQINDCNDASLTADESDLDGDGWVACTLDAGGWDGPSVPSGGGDCADEDRTVFPTAPERCDGLINNCLSPSLPADEVDNDGDGVVECTVDAGGWDGVPARTGGDCDDTQRNRFPGAPELCDGLINDCGAPTLGQTEVDNDGDGYVECVVDGGGWRGVAIAGGQDCDDSSLWAATVFPGASERCDGVLNDCTEAGLPADEIDDDLDGYVECADLDTWRGPSVPVGRGDCDDTDDTRFPSAPERCDGQINNCLTAVLPANEVDNDGDRYVDCAVLDAGGWDGAAPAPDGAGDCDDTDATVFPAALERCDGQINDCRTLILPTNERDLDLDGYVTCTLDAGGWDAGPAPTGGDDCDDTDRTVFPTAVELCDGQINDCRLGAVPVSEVDNDADGYVECLPDAGGWDGPFAPVGGADCDDTSPDAATVFPGAFERCDGIVNACGESLSPLEIDNDGDRYVECTLDEAGWDGDPAVVGGDDCNDANPFIFPAEVERCDGLPNACGSLSADEIDNDGDGYVECTIDPGGWRGDPAVIGGDDCDDVGPDAATIFPGAPELCDGLINTCGGSLPAVEIDSDLDGFVDCAIDPDGWDGPIVPVGGRDCDDSRATVFPTAPDRCDGLINDCDLVALSADEVDNDGDGAVECTLAPEGWQAGPPPVGGDCDDTDPTVRPGAAELCDGQANSCGALPASEIDDDRDGYVECAADLGTWRGPAIRGGADCDDTDETVFPTAPERCDGQVNTCGGALPAIEVDGDGDGYVDCVLDAGGWDAVPAPLGGADCDDTDRTVFPGAPERCDGQINACGESLPTNEIDDDRDGYVECPADLSWVGSPISGGDDCDDADPTVFPRAPELCDGQVNACGGALPAIEQDNDGDLYVECELAPSGWRGAPEIRGGGDCDDVSVHAPTIFPSAPEICDGLKNDCLTVEPPAAEADNDGDGYVDCAFDPSGWDGTLAVVGGEDCDDTDRTVFPGAAELCDGQDNSCDGLVAPSELDDDGDNHVECVIDVGGWDAAPVRRGGDCDDEEPTRFPGAAELCDGQINNCDTPLLPGNEVDDDGDRFVECVVDPAGWDGDPRILGGGDCDDAESTLFPAAPELCDGQINDCGRGALPGNEIDNDGDGFVECRLDGGGWDGAAIAGGDDCDDTSAQAASIYPEAPELCDGLINNCRTPVLPADEVDDDRDFVVDCTFDVDGWHGDPRLADRDCDDGDATVYPDAPTLCDGLINDCDQPLLDGVEVDDDGDFYVECTWDRGGWDGAPMLGGDDCDDRDETVFPTAPALCDGLANDCVALVPDEIDDDRDGYVDCPIDAGGWNGGPIEGGDDCDDTDPTIFPTAPQVCDGLINDCRRIELESDEVDDDVDGYVECDFGPAGWRGAPGVIGDLDCDDTDETINPGMAELCDGQDNNCDLLLDPTEIDDDGDRRVDCLTDVGGWDGAPILGDQDCNDADETVYPGAAELCDGQINDCTLPALPANESDVDDDGYVRCTIDAGGWNGGPISGDQDCVDRDETVFPGAPELCDGQDNNCDGVLPDDEDDSDDNDLYVECSFAPGEWDGNPAIRGGGDCGRGDPTVNPAAPDLCGNGVDDNCDGLGAHASPGPEGYLDDDADGLLFNDEEILGTDDCDLDSDDDGLDDDVELQPELDLDPTDPDFDGDGILDGVEVGDDPSRPADTDGDGTIDAKDEDDDGDSVNTAQEAPGGRSRDNDDDFVPDHLDDDDDNDGVPTLWEEAFGSNRLRIDTDGDLKTDGEEWFNWLLGLGPDPSVLPLCGVPLDLPTGRLSDHCLDLDGGMSGSAFDAPWDRDADGIINALDADDDGDGLNLVAEQLDGPVECTGPNDRIPPTLDFDTDGDGLGDAEEGRTDEDGDLLPNFLDCDSEGCDGDSDNDGLPNCRENYLFELAGREDFALAQNDPDFDDDGRDDGVEAGTDPDCFAIGVEDTECVPADLDGDGIIDLVDLDDDGDGFTTAEEIVPFGACVGGVPVVVIEEGALRLTCSLDGSTLIPRNTDADVGEVYPVEPDEIPDAADPDDDGDRRLTVDEGTGDLDLDGTPNWIDFNDFDGPDADADADTLSNRDEATLGTNPFQADSDRDGVDDGTEVGGILSNPNDSDEDGIIDALDDDDDNDGLPTRTEGSFDLDGDQIGNHLDLDSDGDGNIDANEGLEDADCDGQVNFLDPADSDGPCGDSSAIGEPAVLTNEGCACQSSPAPGPAGLLALAFTLLLRRRRR